VSDKSEYLGASSDYDRVLPKWTSFFGAPFLVLLAFALVYGYDSRGLENPLSTLRRLIANPDRDAALSVEGSYGRVFVNLFAVMVTSSTFIVQLASQRFSPVVRRLFLQKPAVRFLFLFFSVGVSYYGFTQYFIRPEETWLPAAMHFVGFLMYVLAPLIVFPFFFWLFDFLEPRQIIQSLRSDASNVLDPSCFATHKREERTKVVLVSTISALLEIARHTISAKALIVTVSAIDSIFLVFYQFSLVKQHAKVTFFTMPLWLRSSPFLGATASGTLEQVEREQQWVEFLVLESYKKILGDALAGGHQDVYVVIFRKTRVLAELLVENNDFLGAELALLFMNTYFRLCLNSNVLLGLYACAEQYRLLVEMLLGRIFQERNPDGFSMCQVLSAADIQARLEGRASGADGTSTHDTTPGRTRPLSRLEVIVKDVAHYWMFYAENFQQRGAPFGSEIILHDLVLVIEQCFVLQLHTLHKALVEQLLSMPHVTREQYAIRALLKLTVGYMSLGGVDEAMAIVKVLRKLPTDDVRAALTTVAGWTYSTFWEVTVRFDNFKYLSPEKHDLLPLLCIWVRVDPEAVRPTAPSEDDVYRESLEAAFGTGVSERSSSLGASTDSTNVVPINEGGREAEELLATIRKQLLRSARSTSPSPTPSNDSSRFSSATPLGVLADATVLSTTAASSTAPTSAPQGLPPSLSNSGSSKSSRRQAVAERLVSSRALAKDVV